MQQKRGDLSEKWERHTATPLTVGALLFLVAYAVPIIRPGLPATVTTITSNIIFWVWIGFGLDYIARFALAKDKWYFFTHNIVDLLSVALPILRPLRLLRLVALLSVLNRIGTGSLRGRVVTYAVGGTALLVFVGALAVTDAERNAPGAGITTFLDGLWWALVTLTTVGYGDEAPVTHTGRLIAVALMLGGIALLGIVTATLSSYLVEHISEKKQQDDDADQNELLAQLAELQKGQQTLLQEIATLSNKGSDWDGMQGAGERRLQISRQENPATQQAAQ